MSTLTIESTRFGTLEIASEDVLEFPNGLIGLGGKQFTIVPAAAGGPFSWLHSIDDPSLALPIANPWHFFADYVVDISDADSAPIAADPADVAVWVTVRAGAELADFHANLRAPILIADGKGHQVINESAAAPVRAPLFPADVAAAA
jgi:flagellar assembly factor FliW